MASRILSEDEFNAVKSRVLASLPSGLTEAEFNRAVGPAMAQAIGEAENSAPTTGAAGRFGSGLWKNLNPITALEGLYSAGRHPLDTGKAVLQAQGAELGKAVDNARQGRYFEAAGHGAAGLIPVLGPAAAAAGERIGSGDVAGGVGEATGLLAPVLAPAAVKGAGAAVRGSVAAARSIPAGADALDAVANMADRASTNRIVDVAAPKVGPNKLRLNAKMADIAPDLAREPDLSALSRQGLAAKVNAKLADATAELDAASDARPVSAQVPTAPLLAAIDERLNKLTAKPLEASRVVPSVEGDAVREVPVNPMQQYALRWILDDIQTFPFTKHTWSDAPDLRGNAGGGHLDLVPGSAGARIYTAIVGPDLKATRAQVAAAANDVLNGKTTGPLRQRIADVANKLVDGDRATVKLMETPGPLAQEEPASRILALGKDVPADLPPRAGRPMGAAVQPEPSGPEIATLQKIRNEVAQLGPVAPYESVRRIRQAWDQVAKPKYSPSLTQDYLAKQSEATGAMKGTGAIRDALAQADPTTAEANAKYSLFKSANDILQATEETERARPRVLRGIVARTGGAMVGAESGGVAGAGVGAILGAVVERAAELAPTPKIVVARQLARVADLLRGGEVQQATSTLRTLAKRLPAARTANQVGQATAGVPQQPRAAGQ
jgi:hypothetical protein